MSQSEKDVIKRIAEEHPEAFKEVQKVMNKGSFFEYLTNFEPKKDLSDEQPRSIINHKQRICDINARQIFLNGFDCYTMVDDDVSEIPAMSEEKFVEIVGKLIYSDNED
jgi:hypothetical protein